MQTRPLIQPHICFHTYQQNDYSGWKEGWRERYNQCGLLRSFFSCVSAQAEDTDLMMKWSANVHNKKISTSFMVEIF